ncbi:winged helix-turn-helix transcriptional regulator [Myroides injenensis]|uniref:winged helix-turn-helix transcriptional regulator n=1 Tax=Myroides injenensis TaxID=1183151 RepID=UPI000287DB3B|nr:helix-turn-helix domain-containing protein [Myroides injenensis]
MFTIKSKEEYENCSVRLAIDILAKSWNVWILLELESGVLRPSELHQIISIAPKRVLTKQIGELEKLGLLSKKVYPEVPLRVEYELTDRGREMLYVVKQLQLWGDKHKKDIIAKMSIKDTK